ncbi:MAG: NAD(P)H-hydrate dehydratase [Bacteroidales bacterium]|nr:NAD(P)H-hydrate dehydratase [Bacteroidales bacterium]
MSRDTCVEKAGLKGEAGPFAGRLLPRAEDGHKGDFGRLLVVAGCQRMPGAALLAMGAALHSGCGLVTLHSTERALQAAVGAYPAAKLSEDPGEYLCEVPALDEYDAIAVGPGLGQEAETQSALSDLLWMVRDWNDIHPDKQKKLLLDADALNFLASHPEVQSLLPRDTVLTPHVGELGRLLAMDPALISEEDIIDFCKKTSCVLVRKGPHTHIYTSAGCCYENTTGNAGLAKGGSGDVLTGLIGGLLARGYDALTAARLGVWIHGAAADYLTAERTAEAWDAGDLLAHLWVGFKLIL